jgi:hypothetical protein
LMTVSISATEMTGNIPSCMFFVFLGCLLIIDFLKGEISQGVKTPRRLILIDS